MKKLNDEQNEKMRYRQIQLDDRLLKINNLINGRGKSFYPFITDRNGAVSEKKTDAFISGLMESLEHYLSVSGKPRIDKNTEEAYRSFLYYALFGLIWTDNKRCTEAVHTVMSETFSDIIDFAGDTKHIECDSYDEFCAMAYRNYRDGASGLPYFFSRMWESLQLLGFAEPFLMWQSREALLGLCREYAKENNISEEDNQRYIDEINDWFDDTDYPEQEFGDEEEMSSEQLEELISEFGEEIERMENISGEIDSLEDDKDYEDNELLRGYSAEEMTAFEKWRAENEMLDISAYWRENAVVDHKRFMESCKNFTRLYFGIDREKMLDDITHMVDTFLFENKLSAFSYGDAYGLVTYQIEKMQDRIEREIERAKKIC